MKDKLFGKKFIYENHKISPVKRVLAASFICIYIENLKITSTSFFSDNKGDMLALIVNNAYILGKKIKLVRGNDNIDS